MDFVEPWPDPPGRVPQLPLGDVRHTAAAAAALRGLRQRAGPSAQFSAGA